MLSRSEAYDLNIRQEPESARVAGIKQRGRYQQPKPPKSYMLTDVLHGYRSKACWPSPYYSAAYHKSLRSCPVRLTFTPDPFVTNCSQKLPPKPLLLYVLQSLACQWGACRSDDSTVSSSWFSCFFASQIDGCWQHWWVRDGTSPAKIATFDESGDRWRLLCVWRSIC